MCPWNNTGRHIFKIHQEKEAFSSVFHRFVKEQYLIPFLEEYANTLPYERIEAFASACEQWIGYLNDFITPNLSEIPDWLTLLQKIVHSSEYLMKSPYSFPDAEMMQISGRPDAILFDPKTKEAVVVEYKARKESDPLQDLAQTSLYSWLVHTSIGILPRVDILYLEEKQPLVRYFVPAIQDIIENHPSLFQLARDILHGKRPVPQCTSPALCQICPYAHTCDGDFGIPVEKTSISPKPVPGNTETHDTPPAPDELLSMLTEKLRLLSIPVIPAGYTVGPRFIRLKIIPDIKKRVTFSKIVNRTVDIQLGLALSSPPLIQAQSGFISCDVQKSNWEPFDVGSLLADTKKLTTHICSFPLGRRIDGSVFVGDLADPNMTSCLIGGTSGSGKSELIRSLVVAIALNNPDMNLTCTLIDPKRVTFTDFGQSPFLSQPVIMDPDRAMDALMMHVSEMEERYRVLENAGCPDISEYNARHSPQMKRTIIVIDEYADLIMNKSTKEALESAIQKIGQKGRAAGFHLILATQRPDAKIITGVIKANLQLKIALKVTSSTNSRIILDETGAECLAGYGDMLIGGSVPIQRLQSAKVSKDDISRFHAGNPHA